VTVPIDIRRQQILETIQQPASITSTCIRSNTAIAPRSQTMTFIPTILTTADEMSLSSVSSEPQDGVTMSIDELEPPTPIDTPTDMETDENRDSELDLRTSPDDPQDISNTDSSLEMIHISELENSTKSATSSTPTESGDKNLSTSN
jgi:hypothetical protein